jgi:hypothetical protein
MMVCGRCRGDGRCRWLVVLTRTCEACDGKGVVAGEGEGFASLVQRRPRHPGGLVFTVKGIAYLDPPDGGAAGAPCDPADPGCDGESGGDSGTGD